MDKILSRSQISQEGEGDENSDRKPLIEEIFCNKKLATHFDFSFYNGQSKEKDCVNFLQMLTSRLLRWKPMNSVMSKRQD